MKLSVAIITFNEERILEKTLSSIEDLADEIIIVDSYSSDRTETICKRFSKLKFIQQKFLGFGRQKNYAISLCTSEWILFLDADEIPDEAAKDSIRKIISDEHQKCFVYDIRFNNIFLGKALKYGGWGNTRRERFFKKGYGKYSEDIVHEEFITTEKKCRLNGRINHYTYKDIHHHIEKSNKYTSMMAEKMYRNGKKATVAKILFKPLYQFIKSYFLRLGFLDGLVGYYAAFTAAFYTFLKYKKLHEITNLNK
ncbi:glycosyltransferase family 2 protein [Chryseobacterium soli]|uniref:glycosyltransferase family 2 protein n=1 Tax=Chryseobacterium soli TaxID=445961 RepID=UPI002955699F|nr:glycosyltransferase family 2 protein [Chryseobacterium soli]MDV7699134.1 glycosyltransferase family 2 protein [Chryseobacterium soli]